MQRLATLGYIVRARAEGDRRITELRLTPAGARAMRASSMLDDACVAAVLGEPSAEERRRALDGLSLLARGARTLSERAPTYPGPADADATDSEPSHANRAHFQPGAFERAGAFKRGAPKACAARPGSL